jgi:hypothetical protein
MDILNFISWIKGKRIVTAVDPASTVLPVGLRDPRRDDNYLAGAITVQDFAAQMPAGPTGAQGPAGPQGVAGPVGPAGLNWQGAWSAAGTYVVDDAVGYGGASWFCIDPVGPSATTPDTDPTNWALLASQGSPGTAGPQGIQGVPGPNDITVNTTTVSSGATTQVLFQSGSVVSEDARFRYLTPRGSLISTGKLNNVQNTALGDFALSNTSGAGLYNTAVGYQALRNLSTGYDNVAIGNTAASQVNTGNGNVAIGKNAMGFGPSNASGLVAIGQNALVQSPAGSVAVGASALSFATGQLNTALGQQAGINVLTGQANVFVGPQTGNGTSSGSNNIFIGYAAGYTGNFNSTCVIGQGSATANNQMVIGEVGSEFGTVAAQVNTSTKYWEVTINGVVEKILLA